ncbi:GNAT family N-acetyltransferase [Luteipulveratus mongoliensis]|uniref:Acetyltransferase n=1 Tax=Luteipulveratus mongoliensis TaxID=571913 RepID=A0A0K1JJT5_9MICO|nr:GNAT family N-acetyltransferase [Luteipulveratus mongoliensis]AKU16843.1 acetyltransferase [Luteipulveratus mongoliensis]
MAIVLSKPTVDELNEAVLALREWQHDGAPVQLHPGDLGWYWRFGAETTAAAVRIWSRDQRILAVGLLDGPGLVRLAIAPEAEHDEDLATQMAADVSRPERGVLPEGSICVEARFGAAFQARLVGDGWARDEPWTPLRRDLTAPVEDCGLRIEVVEPEQAHLQTAVHQASFGSPTFTDERWHAMASGVPYADALSLLAYDGHDTPVATATVWSAGPDKPGLLEPVGVHPDYRGHGYGKAMSIAAASALRDMSSSSALVCTPSSNVGAVATYASAGFEQLPDVRDLCRSA